MWRLICGRNVRDDTFAISFLFYQPGLTFLPHSHWCVHHPTCPGYEEPCCTSAISAISCVCASECQVLSCRTNGYCWWKKSGVHQLRLVVYPVIFEVFLHPRWCRISSNGISDMVTLPETSKAPEELVGWKMKFCFGDDLFTAFGGYIELQECINYKWCPDFNWSRLWRCSVI